jgi:formylglycine-generating enzyme required for sulfatase activity
MAYVAGGEFMMGSANGDEYERPPHKVTVRAFYVDEYEVTCQEYARFVKAEKYAAPPGWRNGQYPPNAAKRPVTGVNWDDANAYANWAGKKLPTEEQWEFAARGPEGRAYPWGNEWKAGMANASGGSGGMSDVGAFKEGIAPSRAYDMIGNAWEWTASDLKPYPGGRFSSKPSGDMKVIRGGSWKEGREATATYRGYLLARGGKDYSATGFRCVREAAEVLTTQK